MKLDAQKFLEVSSIHGLFYISKRFHITGRIFWTVAFIFSVIGAIILIVELAIKMHIIPIIVYVADQPISVTEIPFPAVTVCPQLVPYIKFSEYHNKRYYRYEKHTAKKYLLENDEFWEMIKGERKVAKLNYSEFFRRYGEKLDQLFSYLKTFEDLANGTLKPEDLDVELLKRLQVIDLVTKRGVFSRLNYAVPADDFLDYINQFSKEFEATSTAFASYFLAVSLNFVSEIITEYGLCYTTNIAFSHDLVNMNTTSDDFRYQLFQPTFKTSILDSPPTELPIKIPSANSVLTLSSFTYFMQIPEIILNDFDGLLVMIHDPFELPTRNSKKLIMHYNQEPIIWIDAKMNMIDESLRDYTPEDRNCYLEDERKLKFFKVYTRNNCEMECLGDFMLSRCGCVEFFMIRNSTTRICMASERNCTESAKSDFLEVKNRNCRCFQPCDYLEYSFEVDDRGFIKQKEIPEYPDVYNDYSEEGAIIYRHYEFRFGVQNFKKAIAKVKYRQKDFELFIRKKQFNVLDFLSFVGGLLGLFAGFSALSFVELIYWYTIRLLTKNCTKFSTKINPENFHEPAEGLVSSYLEKSSIHGLKFLRSHAKIDIWIWILFIISSLTVCFDMILKVRDKIQTSRVTVYDDNLRPMEDVEFPAISLVPEYYYENDFYWMDMYSLLPILPEVAYKNHSEQLAYQKRLGNEFFCRDYYDLYYMDANVSFVPFQISFLKEHSSVKWFRKQFSSLNGLYQPAFAEIRTSRGMGFAFNMVDDEELFDFSQISENFKYTTNVSTIKKNLKNIPKSNFPLKFNTYDRPALKFKLVRPVTEKYVCILPSLLVHNSDYMPTFAERKEFIHFQYGMTVDVEVTPKIIKTDEDLRKLTPEERGCYFDNERSLKYFKKYSQKNCEIECYTNKTFDICNCTGLYQPFLNESQMCSTMVVMHEYNDSCAIATKKSLDTSEYFSYERNCSCLPLCNSISYNVKYTAEFNTKGSTKRKTGEETMLNVWMNMDDIVLLRRYQQFSSSDVVSYVGGLLDLFAGVSMLSIVEFLYFFTLRVSSDVWRRMRRRKVLGNGWVDGF